MSKISSEVLSLRINLGLLWASVLKAIEVVTILSLFAYAI